MASRSQSCAFFGRLPALAGMLALGGCNLGPAYHQPQVAAPRTWTPVVAESAPAAPAPDTWPSSQWWQGFGSGELDVLIVQAEKANDDLLAAFARVQQADAQVRISGAALLPSLDANFTPARQREILPMVPVTALSTNTFPAQLSAAYELDFWGKNRALRQAAVALALGSRYDRATVQLSVLASVATTYFTALSLRERLNIATNNITNARQTLRGLQLEQTVGTATALDVAQQQTVVDTEDATVPALNAQLGQTVAALAILVGTTPEQLDLAQTGLSGMTAPPVSAGLPAQLLARRPDVASAEAQLISANANVRAARAAFFPDITLTAAGGVESTALSALLEPASRIFTLSAGITQPIFAGGLLTGQYQLNEARYDELLADYHKAVISAFGNVEQALTTAHETAEQLRRQQLATQTAQRAYDFAQAQFHAGTINILNVLNTETALLTAEDTLAQVKLAHLSALVGLYQALGGGWEQEQEHR